MSLFDLFNHKFPYTNFHELNLDWLVAQVKNLAKGLPAGGTTGQVLAKKSGTDFDTEWTDPTAGPQGPQGPAGPTGPTGATGATGPGVAAGGTTGQELKKKSSTDYDTEWGDFEGLPSGGNNGDVLTKAVTGPMWAPPGGYTLPIATDSRLGGVKVGSGLQITGDGVLSAIGGGGGNNDNIISSTVVNNMLELPIYYIDPTLSTEPEGTNGSVDHPYASLTSAIEHIGGCTGEFVYLNKSGDRTVYEDHHTFNGYTVIREIRSTNNSTFTLDLSGSDISGVLILGGIYNNVMHGNTNQLIPTLDNIIIESTGTLALSPYFFRTGETISMNYCQNYGTILIDGSMQAKQLNKLIGGIQMYPGSRAYVNRFNLNTITNTGAFFVRYSSASDSECGPLPIIELVDCSTSTESILDGPAQLWCDSISPHNTTNHTAFTLY